MPDRTEGPPRIRPADDLERAVIFVLIAAATLPVVNACAKYLSGYPVIEVTWARYAGHAAFMIIVFAPRHGLALLRSSRPGMQVLRSSVHCASAGLTFYAIAFVSLPTATAISFSAPLMVTALAPFVLGERVGLARWLAVAAGFSGALIVIRPGASGTDWAVILLLLNAGASAMIQLMSRHLAAHDPAITSNTYMVLVGFVLTSLPLPFLWTSPRSLPDGSVFVCIGVVGGIGHYMLVRAFELAPAAFVSPFTYCQIIAATLLGYLIFGQLPDLWTWVGAAVIVASGLFILNHERRRRLAT